MRQRPFRIVPLATLALALTSCSRGSDSHAQDVASAGNDGNNTPAADDGDGTPVANDGDNTPVPFRTPVPPPGSSFVHLFEWKWTDIAKECEAYLGPAGFEAVQVSPPSEHAVLADANHPWWQRYQTVSYSLENSRSGTLDEFEDMVTRCARVGVGIYVDAVINHMTGQASGTGSNGTPFTKYDYPGMYTEADFHTPQCGIADTDYVSNSKHFT
jgi:glycosidase